MAGPQHRTPEYRAARKAYTKAQREGRYLECVQPVCVMGNRTIAPHQPVHVAHDDSGTVILGPAHSTCNTTDGGVRRHGGTVVSGHTSTSGGTLAKRECMVCGSTYTPTYSKQATCSRACGVKMKKLGIVPAAIPARVTKACKSCGIHFPHDGTPRTYCENCGPPSSSIRKVDARTCDRCGTQFEQRGRGRRRRYCHTCSNLRPPVMRAVAVNTRTCDTCGQQFEQRGPGRPRKRCVTCAPPPREVL